MKETHENINDTISSCEIFVCLKSDTAMLQTMLTSCPVMVWLPARPPGALATCQPPPHNHFPPKLNCCPFDNSANIPLYSCCPNTIGNLRLIYFFFVCSLFQSHLPERAQTKGFKFPHSLNWPLQKRNLQWRQNSLTPLSCDVGWSAVLCNNLRKSWWFQNINNL